MGGEDKVGEEAGGRRVGVLYVERGVGEGGGAEVRVELQATGGGLTTGGEETVLTEVSVVGAAVTARAMMPAIRRRVMGWRARGRAAVTSAAEVGMMRVCLSGFTLPPRVLVERRAR